MASAYSILHNYNQELYSPNLELINNALQFKQQSLNANRMKLQTMYDQFSFLDVAKEEDQEYLEGRLQATKTIMDKYSMLDLSSNNLTSQLVSNMSNIVDDNVKNAVISTRRYRGEQAAWQKLREESPEKYSQTNHAYASQYSDAWLMDGKTGSKYNGGGGVIEYVDVQGKLSEKIPDIAENLKAEWVELSQGGGYFRDVVTKERVSRDQLEAAMDGLLNEQDRRQLRINAWGAYDGMSDQGLEAAYTSHFQPKINQLQSEIASLEKTIIGTKDPEMKQYRQGLLDFYRTQLEAYEANSYKNVVANYGREAAYNTLYDNQFRSNYLDTYSYADRVTKIATYDNDVKQRNYEFKLAEFEWKKENEDFNQAVKLKELDLKERELALKELGDGSTKKPGDPGYVRPLTGTEAVLEYDETETKIKEHQEKNEQIVKDVKNLFNITDDATLRELSNVFNEGFAGKEYIEFNGQKIKVEDNLSLLLDYNNNILNDSAVEKEALGEFNKAVTESLNTLREITQGDNPDWIAEESVPRFNFRFEWDEETGTMKKIKVTDSPLNPYAHLLGKENLSEAEQFTLEVYHSMHLLMDPELKDEEKNLIFKDLQTNKFTKLSNEDFNSFPYDIHAYNRMSTKRVASGAGLTGHDNKDATTNLDTWNVMRDDGFFAKYSDFAEYEQVGGTMFIKTFDGYSGIMQDIADAYKGYAQASEQGKEKYREKINSLTAILETDRETVGLHKNVSAWYTADYYITDITKDDAEYYNKDGKEVSLKSPKDIIEKGMELYANTLEQEYKGMYMEPSLYPQVFSTETSGYESLATLVGLPSNTKVPITLERVWDPETRKPTNEVKWIYQLQNTKDGQKVTQNMSSEVDPGNKRLTVDQLRENGIIDFGDGSRSNYDASWGESAPKVDLGNNIYDPAVKERNVSRYGPGTLPLSVENTKPLLDDASKYGGQELRQEIRNDWQSFQDGAYEFKMESINGFWQYAIYDNTGQRVYNEYTEPTAVTQYSNQEITGIFRENEYVINTVMYNYLESKVNKAYEQWYLDYQEQLSTDL